MRDREGLDVLPYLSFFIWLMIPELAEENGVIEIHKKDTDENSLASAYIQKIDIFVSEKELLQLLVDTMQLAVSCIEELYAL